MPEWSWWSFVVGGVVGVGVMWVAVLIEQARHAAEEEERWR